MLGTNTMGYNWWAWRCTYPYTLLSPRGVRFEGCYSLGSVMAAQKRILLTFMSVGRVLGATPSKGVVLGATPSKRVELGATPSKGVVLGANPSKSVVLGATPSKSVVLGCFKGVCCHNTYLPHYTSV